MYSFVHFNIEHALLLLIKYPNYLAFEIHLTGEIYGERKKAF